MIYQYKNDVKSSVRLPVFVVLKEIMLVVFVNFLLRNYFCYFRSQTIHSEIESLLIQKIRRSLFIPKFKYNICKGKYIFRL